jgi:hypothetical protein
MAPKMITSNQLSKRLPAATGISEAEATHRVLTLIRAEVLPRSKRGRGAGTPLTDGDMADALLSLLSPEALNGPEWAARFGKMICLDETLNGQFEEPLLLRDWMISMIGRAGEKETALTITPVRILSRCHPEKPYVEVTIRMGKRLFPIMFAESKDLETLDTLVHRSMVIDGRIFPLVANWLWGDE